MSFNSKYTGAQVQELLGKIPTANDIWHKGNLTKLSQLENDSAFITTSQLSSYSPYYASTARTLVDSQGGKSVVYVSGTRFYIGDSIYPTTQTHILGNSIHLRYGEDANTGLMLNSSGNVGIGTTSPTRKLDIVGSMSLTGEYKIGGYDVLRCYNNTLEVGRETSFYQSYSTNIWGNGINFYNKGGNQLLVVTNGGNVGIGTTNPGYKLDVNGDIHASGSITQNSDINLKNISKDILISLNDISEAPLFEFTYKSDKDKRIHVGTSAQYWVEKNNWFCKKQNNGYYDMEIQNLALASAISIAKEFKKYKEETESTISSMKKEIEELKQIILNMNK